MSSLLPRSSSASNGYVSYERDQELTDAQHIQAQENVGMVYDAAKGGMVVTIAEGAQGFIPMTEVPE